MERLSDDPRTCVPRPGIYVLEYKYGTLPIKSKALLSGGPVVRQVASLEDLPAYDRRVAGMLVRCHLDAAERAAIQPEDLGNVTIRYVDRAACHHGCNCRQRGVVERMHRPPDERLSRRDSELFFRHIPDFPAHLDDCCEYAVEFSCLHRHLQISLIIT